MRLLVVILLSNILCIGYTQPAKDISVKNIKPFILGEIHEINSGILNEKRILNIYLPQEYKNNDTVKHHVIYLLDGSSDEDFIHVTGLVQFSTFPWINQLPPTIVVGIANVDRLRDFTHLTSIQEDKKAFPNSGGSAKFISFLEKEVQPYINRNFRVSDESTLIGQSLGGLLATEILLTKTNLFDRYIIISPSLWWNNGSLLKDTLYNPLKEIQTVHSVYVGVGREGLTPGTIPRVMEVDANLLADKLKQIGNPYIKTYFDYLPAEDHATITHQAIFNAFRILFEPRKYN